VFNLVERRNRRIQKKTANLAKRREVRHRYGDRIWRTREWQNVVVDSCFHGARSVTSTFQNRFLKQSLPLTPQALKLGDYRIICFPAQGIRIRAGSIATALQPAIPPARPSKSVERCPTRLPQPSPPSLSSQISHLSFAA
jgi:hypothetical protein